MAVRTVSVSGQFFNLSLFIDELETLGNHLEQGKNKVISQLFWGAWKNEVKQTFNYGYTVYVNTDSKALFAMP